MATEELHVHPMPGKSEAAVQARKRLYASKIGGRLWRNNVGVLPDKRGVPVRFGLCNETSEQNRVCKSSDLIGIYPRLIMPEDVGSFIGQFWASEEKHGDWTGPSDAHEHAQLAYLNLVRSLGGRAEFDNGVY